MSPIGFHNYILQYGMTWSKNGHLEDSSGRVLYLILRTSKLVLNLDTVQATYSKILMTRTLMADSKSFLSP